MRYIILIFAASFFVHLNTFAQLENQHTVSVIALKQQTFSNTVPAGNYSGMVHIDRNRYAIVDDKSKTDGFHIFDIDIDSISGRIITVKPERFLSSGLENRDGEGIAFRKSDSTIYVSGERGNRILQYTLDGKLTGKEFDIPKEYLTATDNYGFESLAYNDSTCTFWTANESTLKIDGEQATSTNKVENIIRIQSFGNDLKPKRQFLYRMDAPVADSKSYRYAMGISEMLALNDNSLLVLEREFFVPPSKLGAFVNCKLYQVWPDDNTKSEKGTTLYKKLVCEVRTTLSLFNHSVANYEGMCLGPKLSDGRQTIIMVSDSQNQYAGVLKDWFKVLILQ